MSKSSLLSHFLVAKRTEEGRFVKVSEGDLYTFDAAHSLAMGKKFGMTEEEHLSICRIARYIYEERKFNPAISSVDTEGGFRISLF